MKREFSRRSTDARRGCGIQGADNSVERVVLLAQLLLCRCSTVTDEVPELVGERGLLCAQQRERDDNP